MDGMGWVTTDDHDEGVRRVTSTREWCYEGVGWETSDRHVKKKNQVL